MWLMNGTTITSSTQISSPGTAWRVAAVGDYNGDGDSDILVQNSSTGQVNMWLMNGTTIQFQHPDQQHLSTTSVPGRWVPGSVMARSGMCDSDFNGDGKSDVLLQNSSSGQVDMWLMNGTAIASSTQIGNNTDPTWHIVASGDFNGDGDSDMLWQNAAAVRSTCR